MNKWLLNDNFFTLKDRFKVASFYLKKSNRWTQGEKIKEFEQKMADFCNVSYATFVSSGSTANSLLAMYVKDTFYTSEKNIVVLPSVTWQTSCSPWIREGFKPVFIDISLDDLSLDLNKLEEYLAKENSKVACVFITSLLGFTPNINKIVELSKKYHSIKFCLDNCESTLSLYKNEYGEYKNISNPLTSTTSTYFGHLIQSIEGGFVFTNIKNEYQYFLMARNHGLTRGLIGYEKELDDINSTNFKQFSNQYVDSRFDFNILGNNFRNIESNAILGMCDLKRAVKYSKHRIAIYKILREKLNVSKFILPKNFEDRQHVPFSLPIIFNTKIFPNTLTQVKIALQWCKDNGIETRPIISGNLLRQTCYKHFADYRQYSVAENVHISGFYVGLHIGVKEKQVLELVEFLNKISI